MPAVSFLRRLINRWHLERQVCRCLALACLLGSTACGGDNEKSDQSEPVSIRGGERLAWNQPADSIPELRSLTFKLYVDGKESSLSDARCDETVSPSGFVCSGGLPPISPGQHALELTSVFGGMESDRSARLVVTVGGSALTTGALSFEQSAHRNSTTCAIEPETGCYGIQVIASDLGAVTALTPIPDGRVMFIEDGQRVRIIDRGTRSAATALPVETDRQLTGLAIDTQFETTRFVFVASTEVARGVLSVNITRYRELENVLAEGATITTGLPIAPGLSTPLAMDGEGLIYVAVPVDQSTSGTRFLGGSGAVMRFDRDGRVPPSNQHASPIVAEGYPVPSALAIDRSNRMVWLTGRAQEQLGDIAAFGISTVSRGTWPSRPFRVARSRTGSEQVESIAIINRDKTGDVEVQLATAAQGRLQLVLLTPPGTVRRVSDIPLGDGYSASAVATDNDGSLYVSGATREGLVSVLKLTKLSK